jgi:ABC-2 type transport system permease protein
MTALIRAELLKLRTRTAAGLLVAMLALVALTVGVSIPKVGDKAAPVPLDDPDVLAGTVGIACGFTVVLVVLLGGLAVTQEYRYGTVTSTYLGEPRRLRILLAKWLTMGIVSVLTTVTTLALEVLVGVLVIHGRDGNVAFAAPFWQMVGATFVVMAAYAVVGVALGALIRNQVAAVVGVLVWMLAVEQLVLSASTAIGRWMPFGVLASVLQIGPALSLDGKLLPVPVAALTLLVYTGAAVALALGLTPRRDVL